MDIKNATLIQRHMTAAYGWIPEISDILAEPCHKRIWAWWHALAYFNERDYYTRLEDAPPGREVVHVMSDDKCEYYAWRRGMYVKYQEMTEEECRKIYGD